MLRVKTKYAKELILPDAPTASLPPARRKHDLLAFHLFLETSSEWKGRAALGGGPANLETTGAAGEGAGEEGALVFRSQTKQSLQLLLPRLAIPTLSDAEPGVRSVKDFHLKTSDSWSSVRSCRAIFFC